MQQVEYHGEEEEGEHGDVLGVVHGVEPEIVVQGGNVLAGHPHEDHQQSEVRLPRGPLNGNKYKNIFGDVCST